MHQCQQPVCYCTYLSLLEDWHNVFLFPLLAFPLSCSHTLGSLFLFLFFHQHTVWLSPTPLISPLIFYSLPLVLSRLTECLNWKRAVRRPSVWGWNSIRPAAHGTLSSVSGSITGLCAVAVHLPEKTPQCFETVRSWQEKVRNVAESKNAIMWRNFKFPVCGKKAN